MSHCTTRRVFSTRMPTEMGFYTIADAAVMGEHKSLRKYPSEPIFPTRTIQTPARWAMERHEEEPASRFAEEGSLRSDSPYLRSENPYPSFRFPLLVCLTPPPWRRFQTNGDRQAPNHRPLTSNRKYQKMYFTESLTTCQLAISFDCEKRGMDHCILK